MSPRHLRIVGSHDSPQIPSQDTEPPCQEAELSETNWSELEPDSVRVSAGETLGLLLHAARTNRTWLQDFADETIEISRDMYEVLLIYKRVAGQENSRAA